MGRLALGWGGGRWRWRYALLIRMSNFPPVREVISSFAVEMLEASVTSRLMVDMPIDARSVMVSFLRADAITWRPDEALEPRLTNVIMKESELCIPLE